MFRNRSPKRPTGLPQLALSLQSSPRTLASAFRNYQGTRLELGCTEVNWGILPNHPQSSPIYSNFNKKNAELL